MSLLWCFACLTHVTLIFDSSVASRLWGICCMQRTTCPLPQLRGRSFTSKELHTKPKADITFTVANVSLRVDVRGHVRHSLASPDNSLTCVCKLLVCYKSSPLLAELRTLEKRDCVVLEKFHSKDVTLLHNDYM